MPDNAIYYQLAYGAIIALLVGYAISLRVRRSALERRRAQQGGA
jgi:CcmD family protein